MGRAVVFGICLYIFCWCKQPWVSLCMLSLKLGYIKRRKLYVPTKISTKSAKFYFCQLLFQIQIVLSQINQKNENDSWNSEDCYTKVLKLPHPPPLTFKNFLFYGIKISLLQYKLRSLDKRMSIP